MILNKPLPDTESPPLGQLQQFFVDALFDSGNERILDQLRGGASNLNRKRLDIYRNNVFHSLISALSDLYPVVKQLVGESFFTASAREYLLRHPPRRAAMVYLAEDFPEFLEQFEHTQQLAWLPDVARVDLARHRAWHAADARALDASTLAEISPETLATCRIELHSSLQLLQSRFPVWQIWQSTQVGADDEERIDPDAGGEAVCICRPVYEVKVRKIDNGTFALLDMLKKGSTLGEALTASADVAVGSSPAEALAGCLQNGFFLALRED